MKSHEHGAYFQFTLGSLKPREFPFEFINRSHLNKGCYGMLHTPLKCNVVNFDIPNGQKSIWDIKTDKITFQRGV